MLYNVRYLKDSVEIEKRKLKTRTQKRDKETRTSKTSYLHGNLILEQDNLKSRQDRRILDLMFKLMNIDGDSSAPRESEILTVVGLGNVSKI